MAKLRKEGVLSLRDNLETYISKSFLGEPDPDHASITLLNILSEQINELLEALGGDVPPRNPRLHQWLEENPEYRPVIEPIRLAEPMEYPFPKR